MEISIDPQVRLDLANETVGRYGEIGADFPQKMANRIKREFHLSLDTVTILTLASHLKQIYMFGSIILSSFISPTKREYANLVDINIDDLMTALAAEYPAKDKTIIKTISDWVIYYEYLR